MAKRPANAAEISTESSTAKRPNVVLPRILDGTYFVVADYLNHPNIRARCQTCGKKCSAAINGTGNLTKHFRNTHPLLLNDLLTHIQKKTEIVANDAVKRTQSTLSFDIHPDKVRELIVNFITSNNLAFRIVRTDSFKTLLRGISGHKLLLPGIDKFNEALNTKYEEIKKEVYKALQGASKVCTASDVWSARAQSYIGMSAHFIDETSLVRKSFLLAFRRIRARCTYDVLGKNMYDIQNEFGLKIEKITNAVTDGGSNYCKAFREYGCDKNDGAVTEQTEEDECDDDLSDFDEDYDEDENEIECVDELERIAIDEIGIDIVGNQIDLEQIRIDVDDVDSDVIIGDGIVLPKQMRCFSHQLNNVAKNDFQKALPSNVQRALNACLRKLRRVWRLVSRSSMTKTICERVFGRMLIQPNDTRWNSLFDAVTVVLELQVKFSSFCTTINKEIPNLKVKAVPLSTSDWTILSDYASVMRPLANGLDILQGDKKACLGYVLPTLFSIKSHLSSSMLNTLSGEKMRDVLLKLIDNRFGPMMELTEENKSLFISSACHPVFKLDWVEEFERCVIKNWVVAALNNNANETANDETTLLGSSEPRSSFFIRYSRRSTPTQDNNELERFLNSNDDRIEILHEFPNIKKLFIDTNTTLSSSGLIERMFNHAGLVFQPRRNRLSSSNFEKTMFLKINSAALSNC